MTMPTNIPDPGAQVVANGVTLDELCIALNLPLDDAQRAATLAQVAGATSPDSTTNPPPTTN